VVFAIYGGKKDNTMACSRRNTIRYTNNISKCIRVKYYVFLSPVYNKNASVSKINEQSMKQKHITTIYKMLGMEYFQKKKITKKLDW